MSGHFQYKKIHKTPWIRRVVQCPGKPVREDGNMDLCRHEAVMCTYGIYRCIGGLLLYSWDKFSLLYDGKWMKLCIVRGRRMGLIKGFWVEFLPFYSQVPNLELWWHVEGRVRRGHALLGSISASLAIPSAQLLGVKANQLWGLF